MNRTLKLYILLTLGFFSTQSSFSQDVSVPLGDKFVFGQGTEGVGEWMSNTSFGIGFYTNFVEGMRLTQEGRLAIGTVNTPNTVGAVSLSDYKLYVCGGILADEWLIPNSSWCDYVFNNDYPLLSLPEVEAHIKQNGHLPNTPSETEIKENGLEVGFITVNQQEKIEELFLHLIDMEKRLTQLENENKALRQQVSNFNQIKSN